MITEEYFLEKVSLLAHMKLILIPPKTAKDVYPKFSEFETTDLDKAIDESIYSEDRFDFTRLLKNMNHRRADRIEDQSRFYHQEEADEAKKFFMPHRYEGECVGGKCQGCKHLKDCKVRAKEWIRNINMILSKKRSPGEGKKMAQDVIRYMNTEFMGGKN